MPTSRTVRTITVPASSAPTPSLTRPLAALVVVLALVTGVVAPLAAQTGGEPGTGDTSTTTSTTTTPTAPTVPTEPTVPTPPEPTPPTGTTDPSASVDPALGPPPPPPEIPDGGIRSAPVDPNLPPPVLRDPTPRIRVLLARLDVLEQEVRLAQVRLASASAATDVQASAAMASASVAVTLPDVQADAAAAWGMVAEAEGRVAEAEDALATAERLLRGAAVNSFMYATGGEAGTAPEVGELEHRRGEVLSQTVLDHRQGLVADAGERLVVATTEVEVLREVAGAADLRVRAVERAIAMIEAELEVRQRELEVRERELEASVRGGGPRTFDPEVAAGGWQLEIMGESAFTKEELQAWYAERGQGGQTSEPVLDVVGYYVEEGRLEGVRADVALAQAVLETGWFRNDDTRRFNNYAGIGHCDSCPTGFQFPSARIGVRAQLQHLKTYVMRDPVFANPLVDRRLYGPAACCQTWSSLTGVWATNPSYGALLLSIYEQMLDWLVAHRTVRLGGA
jgi:hypothetical protein